MSDQQLKAQTIFFQPLQDFILIDRLTEKVGTTPGGLVLPESVKMHDDLFFGRVTAIGPGRVTAGGGRVKPCVDTGHIVAYAAHSTRNPNEPPQTKINGKGFDLLRENEILAIIYTEEEATQDDFEPLGHLPTFE